MKIKKFFDPETNSFTYVVSCEDTNRSILIDPVMNFVAASGKVSSRAASEVLDYMTTEGLALDYIFETHVHADHISATPYFKDKLGGKSAISAGVVVVQDTFGEVFNEGPDFKRDGSQFDVLMEDGDEFSFGNLTLKSMSTPGHTPSCMTFLVEDAAFVGDTLFMPDFGTARCDFPKGDARLLYKSIQKTLSLPLNTRLFMCHDYGPGGREIMWETSVEEQRKANIHIKDGVGEEEYVEMRRARDAQLSVPKLLLPSVQINMKGGKFTPLEDNGVFYLKLPVTFE
jgi:glyoxylase-like metal-dependent hydrolase (beta-lactamase superfamily II)